MLWLQNKTAWISEVKSQQECRHKGRAVEVWEPEEVSVPGAEAFSALLSNSSSVKFHFPTLINSLPDIFMGNQGAYIPAMLPLPFSTENQVLLSILQSDTDASVSGKQSHKPVEII